ncbi:glycolate oxidase [Acrocarpospora phusangensis]|uniref:Glycolate oxidase n=1 Tax=Acrocarpospora phusangensis TaxID=1070424 RepID=A0A919QFU7_9ACTN|nr:FAD-binding oxidoreductase [Acrocarpospora phusangensis]GIH26625.1 glycolate oxidase [Acrocarpospora phusangensis]
MPQEALAKTGVTVRVADAGDTVAGVQAKWVALPESTEEVAALLRVAAEHDLAVTPVGGGTKLDWGPPPERCDLLVDLCCLNEVLEYAPGDLVVRVQTGITLDALNEHLAAENQELALESPVPGTTVGGLLATALSGPRRFRYGTPRDLVIGVTVVLADGTTARSGGKVVKNVAGYDLGKLFAGSYGTLGVITEATFRLHPLPPARLWVTATYPELGDAPGVDLGTLAVQLAASQAEPAAVELDWSADSPGYTVSALLEGTAAPTKAETIRQVMTNPEISWSESPDGAARAEVSESPPDWWGRLPEGAILLEIRVPPSSAGAVVRELATSHLTGHTLRGSAASGVFLLALPAGTPKAGTPEAETPATAATVIERLRERIEALDGRLLAVSGPVGAADRWGTIGALDLMRRVKARFDPDRRMSPGRFVGGI